MLLTNPQLQPFNSADQTHERPSGRRDQGNTWLTTPGACNIGVNCSGVTVGTFPDGRLATILVAARLRHVSTTNGGSWKYMNAQLLEGMDSVYRSNVFTPLELISAILYGDHSPVENANLASTSCALFGRKIQGTAANSSRNHRRE